MSGSKEASSPLLWEGSREAIDMLGLRRRDAGVELRLAPLPTVPCHRIRIREVFCNLLANAAKYNDQAEKWIEVGQASDELQGDKERNGETVIYVRDNGIGIKLRYYEQIFKIFKRLHARGAFGGGTGSGLTIARKIVDRHGGRLWLESDPAWARRSTLRSRRPDGSGNAHEHQADPDP